MIFWIFAFLSLVSSILFYPYIDAPLFVVTLGILLKMNNRFLILGLLLTLVVDFIWGRIVGFSFVLYLLYIFVVSTFFLKSISSRDSAYVFLVAGYSLLYTLFSGIFSSGAFLWKEALFYVLFQSFLAFLVVSLLAFMRKYRAKRVFLSTKNMRF